MFILFQDCRPKLCEFGFISGRIIGEMNTLKKQMPISIGFVDPSFAAKGLNFSLSLSLFKNKILN